MGAAIFPHYFSLERIRRRRNFFVVLSFLSRNKKTKKKNWTTTPPRSKTTKHNNPSNSLTKVTLIPTDNSVGSVDPQIVLPESISTKGRSIIDTFATIVLWITLN